MLRSDITRFARLALSGVLALQLLACSIPRGDWGDAISGLPDTTFGKFLARAVAGDAESQNVVGFMLFHGEGVRMDRDLARSWFQRAAAQGNPRAQRNLAMMISSGAPESGLAPSQQQSRTVAPASSAGGAGSLLFGKFCAGCHGFNGISAYVQSPSFALGETLEKGDAELMGSLMRGKGEMPNWDNKFSPDELWDVLRFVRTLRAKYELGIGQTLSGAPPVFYLFGPMAPGHSAYRGFQSDFGFGQPPTDR